MSRKRKKSLYNKRELYAIINQLFDENPTYTYTYRQVARVINAKDLATKQLINTVMYEMKSSGVLYEESTGKFKRKSQAGYITGKVDMTSSGSAYIVSEEVEEDIFISQSNLLHALNGDEVKIRLFAQRKSRRPEGEVIEIVKRYRTKFVGIVEICKNYAFLVPPKKDMPYDIFIPLKNLKHAKDGDMAIAQITDWPSRAKNPFGKIIEVLGKPGENETEMHAILAEFMLPYHFPKDVERAADEIVDEITKEEISNREDMREVTTFTIDPFDAKDFDDALSVKKIGDNWEIGVHIADVSHYVTPKSSLDNEAFERATSVYLVDRVVPMLPERLSNGICSLRPNEEKLCYSFVCEMNENAEIQASRICKTVIKSDRRFTYEEAQQIIETGKGDFSEEIVLLDKLAKKLRDERFKKGSIAFDREEVKFEIDENGKPLSVYFKEAKDSNKLIEDFMLLANRKVAEFIGKKEKPKSFVYRVHEKPADDKLESLNNFISRFGYKLKMNSQKAITDSINNLLEDIKGKKENNIISTLAIRAMSKAEYTVDNVGHYGLSFEYYTHFTSPIRRYPDVLVHRLLTSYLKGDKSVDITRLEEKCKHCSEMENRAASAERASIKYKQVEFLNDQEGEQFEGVISGVTEWGVYVELNENKCEGMVAIRDMQDDVYEFDEQNYCIVGRNYKNKYQLGDEVKIEVLRADLVKKQLDFIFVE